MTKWRKFPSFSSRVQERKSLIQWSPCKSLANPDVLGCWTHLHGTGRQDMGHIWSWKLGRFVILGQHHKQHYLGQLNQDQTITDLSFSKRQRLLSLLRQREKKKTKQIFNGTNFLCWGDSTYATKTLMEALALYGSCTSYYVQFLSNSLHPLL